MSSDLFDGFSKFGDRILHGIRQGERPARKYKTLLHLINTVLKTTHEMVLETLDRVVAAKTLEEAQAALAELEVTPLEESFRLEGLCDAFGGLGFALDELTYRSEQAADSVASDVEDARPLAQMLANREAEVARLYTTKIEEVADLLRGGNSGDLAALKTQAAKAKTKLTDQMADFTVKAQKFTRVTN